MWIRGIDHRIDSHQLGLRDLTQSPSAALAAEKAGVGKAPVDIAELHAPFTHQELILRSAMGLGESVRVNPSGGAMGADTIMVAGLARIGEAARQIWSGNAGRAVAHATRRSVSTAEPCLRVGGRVMAERSAVVGIGQTKLDAKRIDVSQVGLVREAAERALEDSGYDWKDIDAVVIGKAPDMFEGVMMPELFPGRPRWAVWANPMLRVHTAGSVGGSTAIVANSLVHGGIHERVLTVTYEKQSESNAMWALSIQLPFQQTIVAGAGGYFAPLIRGYMRRSGGGRRYRHPGSIEGSPERAEEPLRAPTDSRHQLRDDSRVADAVGTPFAIWNRVRPRTAPVPWLSPTRRTPRNRRRTPRGSTLTAMRTEPTMFAGRDQVNPQARP